MAPVHPDPNKEIAEENLSHFAEPPLMLSSDISGHEKQVLFISTGAANTRPVRGPRRDEDEDEEEGDEGEEEEGEEEDEEEELADKLHLLFDFNDPKELEEDKEYKRRFLLELVDYVNCGTMKFNEAVFKDITRMLEINLFRPLPPSAPAMSGSEPKNPKEEDPTMEAAWLHLQIVYELLKYVVFNETDQRLKLFVDQQFILKLLNLFDSEDPRERDYLKSILHRIYLKFMDHRQFIRKAINDIFDQFIESERHNGIVELLEPLGSFVNGFVLPLEQEHKQSLERVLVPLHKPKCVSMYHEQLSYCITQFVEKDPKLADLVLRGLLKFWPLANSQNELLFLGELEEILELTQAPEFETVMTPLFQQIARCLSWHFQVAERTLRLEMFLDMDKWPEMLMMNASNKSSPGQCMSAVVPLTRLKNRCMHDALPPLPLPTPPPPLSSTFPRLSSLQDYFPPSLSPFHPPSALVSAQVVKDLSIKVRKMFLEMDEMDTMAAMAAMAEEDEKGEEDESEEGEEDEEGEELYVDNQRQFLKEEGARDLIHH
ncbi:unnamed protein product [Closterium sp. Naga37s-1]|nr:unnamed protein product [Closterium sp. Naga37s-1]